MRSIATSRSIGIIGTGHSLPTRRVSNSEIATTVRVAPEWIEARTGIRERRFADSTESNTGLASQAGRAAVTAAGLTPSDIGLILLATSTPEQSIPPTAARVQAQLGADRALAFDLNAACAGFVLATETARTWMATMASLRYTLVIGSDVYSRILNPADRQTYTIFGDGAGAAVLGAVSDGYGLLGTRMRTDGRLADIAVGGPRLPAQADAESHQARMVGHEVAAIVKAEFPVMLKEVMDTHGISLNDIDYLACHQANPRLVRRCAMDLGFRPEQLIITGDTVGNTAAASIPIGLDVATRDGRLTQGDLVLMVCFGAGMTWGWSLMRWTTQKHTTAQTTS